MLGMAVTVPEFRYRIGAVTIGVRMFGLATGGGTTAAVLLLARFDALSGRTGVTDTGISVTMSGAARGDGVCVAAGRAAEVPREPARQHPRPAWSCRAGDRAR